MKSLLSDISMFSSLGVLVPLLMLNEYFLFIYFLKKTGELTEMSGIFTLVIMGLFLNSTSFKPGVEALLLE